MRGQFYILAAVIVLTSIYLTARYLNEGSVVQPSAPSDEVLFTHDVEQAFNSLMEEDQIDFRTNFYQLQEYLRERSFGAFSMEFYCNGTCPSDTLDIRSSGSYGTINTRINTTREEKTEWWDDDSTDAFTYSNRVKIVLSENSGIARTNLPIIISGSDLSAHGIPINSVLAYSIRVVDPSLSPDEPNESGGNDLPVQVDEMDGTGDYVASPNHVIDSDDEIVFVENLTAYEVKDLYLYYNTSGSWSSKAYTTDLSVSSTNVSNAYYLVSYSSDWSSIDYFSIDYDNDGSFTDETSLTSSMAPIIAGTYITHAGRGLIISGPVRVIIDSAIYELNCSDFSGNITRRIIQWEGLPAFKMTHKVDAGNNYASEKIQVEQMTMTTNNWYRVFYQDPVLGDTSSWNSTIISEPEIPTYLYAYSESGGAAGFIFPDSPSAHDASTVMQLALEREAGVDYLSRKAWLREGHANSAEWEAWVYATTQNFTTRPRLLTNELTSPIIEWTGYAE